MNGRTYDIGDKEAYGCVYHQVGLQRFNGSAHATVRGTRASSGAGLGGPQRRYRHQPVESLRLEMMNTSRNSLQSTTTTPFIDLSSSTTTTTTNTTTSARERTAIDWPGLTRPRNTTQPLLAMHFLCSGHQLLRDQLTHRRIHILPPPPIKTSKSTFFYFFSPPGDKFF